MLVCLEMSRWWSRSTQQYFRQRPCPFFLRRGHCPLSCHTHPVIYWHLVISERNFGSVKMRFWHLKPVPPVPGNILELTSGLSRDLRQLPDIHRRFAKLLTDPSKCNGKRNPPARVSSGFTCEAVTNHLDFIGFSILWSQLWSMLWLGFLCEAPIPAFKGRLQGSLNTEPDP